MRDKRGAAWKAGLALLLIGSGLGIGGCGLFDFLPTLPPDRAPTGVKASLAEKEDRIEVNWHAVEGATSYRILRADSEDGPYGAIGNVQCPTLTYTDIVGSEYQGRLYWYKVQACNDAGCGPPSSAAPGYAGHPPAPTDVKASTDDRDKIVITWNSVPGATRYQVFRDRHPDGDFPTLVGQPTTNQIEDTAARPGLTYWYRVRACREVPGEVKCGALSSPAQGYRPPRLPPAAEHEEI